MLIDSPPFPVDCPPSTSPDVIRRIHAARLQMIDVHRASERESRRVIVSRDDTRRDAQKATEIRSNIRTRRAPPDDIAKYLWSRDAITPRQTATMEESVDKFLHVFKCAHQKLVPEPRILSGTDIPPDLASAAVVAGAVERPTKLTRAFAAARRRNRPDNPIRLNLPDIEATHRFREFLAHANIGITAGLEKYMVSEPMAARGPSGRRRRKTRPPLDPE
jgi:hypothetical protein